MSEGEEIPRRDWFYWFLIALCAYAAVTQFIQFLAHKQPYALFVSVGAALVAAGLPSGWPLRRKGERLSSMSRPRAVGSLLCTIGAIVFTLGGLWHLAAR